MTWSITSLPNSASYKISGTAANAAVNATNPVAGQPAPAAKPKTAEDFAKLSFSGQAKNTGLATVNTGPDANLPGRKAKVQPAQPPAAGSPEGISTDKKRQIMTNLQRDLENRGGSSNMSDTKKAVMNEVSKTLKEADLKAASDQDIEKLFTQVQENLKINPSNRAYQAAASLFNPIQSQMNLIG